MDSRNVQLPARVITRIKLEIRIFREPRALTYPGKVNENNGCPAILSSKWKIRKFRSNFLVFRIHDHFFTRRRLSNLNNLEPWILFGEQSR